MSGGQKTMMPQHLAQGAACCNPRPQQRFGLAAGSRQGGGGGGLGEGLWMGFLSADTGQCAPPTQYCNIWAQCGECL